MIALSNKDAELLATFVETFHKPSRGESLARTNLKRRAWLVAKKIRTKKNNVTK